MRRRQEAWRRRREGEYIPTPYDANVNDYLAGLQDEANREEEPMEYRVARVLFWEIWKKLVDCTPKIDPQDVWIIRELIRWMIRDNEGMFSHKKGIILIGTYGCGKTTLLQAAKIFMKEYTKTPFVFRRVNDILIEVAKKGNIDAMEPYFSGHLILDDIGQMEENIMIYGSRYNVIETIINRRVGTPYITLATTNIKPPEVREKYGPVVGSRFNQMFTPVIFKTKKDHRVS